MNHCNDFIDNLTVACGGIYCVNESYQEVYCKELSIVEAFIDAVESGDSILVNGEKATLEDLDDSTIEAVVARLQLVVNGEPVPIGPFPVQDDICHHPGCEYGHEYDDEYFHDHCELCDTWLHINMPISIIRHSIKDVDFSTCHECTTEDKYLQGGYTDDAGILQCIRADSDALLRMVDTAYKRAQIEGVESGQDFFEKREQFKSTYETVMNSIAKEWNMGDDDNFDFLKDHANDILENIYLQKRTESNV
jgi:hypothetical protein